MIDSVKIKTRKIVPKPSQEVRDVSTLKGIDDLPLHVGQQTCTRCGRHEQGGTRTTYKSRDAFEWAERTCSLCGYKWCERTANANPPKSKDTRPAENVMTYSGASSFLGSVRHDYPPCTECNSKLHKPEECNMQGWWFDDE